MKSIVHRILCFILAFCLTLTCVGCGSNETTASVASVETSDVSNESIDTSAQNPDLLTYFDSDIVNALTEISSISSFDLSTSVFDEDCDYKPTAVLFFTVDSLGENDVKDDYYEKVNNGGCIEIYEDSSTAESRDYYLTGFFFFGLTGGVHDAVNKYVIQISKELSDEDQKNIINELTSVLDVPADEPFESLAANEIDQQIEDATEQENMASAPDVWTNLLEKHYEEVKKLFEDAGFTNVTCVAHEIDYNENNVFEGSVVNIAVGENGENCTFEKGEQWVTDIKIRIDYRVKPVVEELPEASDTTPPNTTSEDSSFEIHFIDVGQADSALVLCDGNAMLIDGGNSEDSDLIYAYLKEHEISYLDYIVATHGHEDHVGGLSGALNYATVGTAFCSVTEYDSEAFSDFVKYLDEQEKSITVPSAGDSFMLGSADVTILGPINESDDPNNTSIVLRVVYGDTSFLFTGDAEREEEQDILDAGYELKSTVLKVGHHGSESSTTYPFLYEIEPEYAVISVGEDNSYGHPTEATLSRLRDADVTVYRTDMQGTVICESNGQEVTFTVERSADVNTLESVTVTPTPEPTPKPTPGTTPEPSPQIEVTDVSETMYATTGVNVRAGPGTDYDVQGTLSTNDDVYVTGETENGWYQIEYYEDVGYVKGSYLSDDMVEITPKPQSETMVWIPNSGSKYHSNSGCSNMKNPSKVTKSQAIAWGYEPCKKCY